MEWPNDGVNQVEEGFHADLRQNQEWSDAASLWHAEFVAQDDSSTFGRLLLPEPRLLPFLAAAGVEGWESGLVAMLILGK